VNAALGPAPSLERLERRQLLSGGDFSLDFVAAAPFTYDHATGGGAFDDRTIGKNLDVVESLEGGDFTCGDIVTYLVAINVDDGAVGAQTIELDFEFLADATGQSGVGHDDIVGVKVNYGAVTKVDVDGDGVLDTIGDGPGNTDSGNIDDSGSVATLTSETLPSNPFHAGTTNLLGSVQVTDCEAGEQIILRVDVHIDCAEDASPTGNLQAAITDADVVAPAADNISVGNQTVPFKNIGELLTPSILVEKTGDLLGKVTDPVSYTLKVTNNGELDLFPHSLSDTLLGTLDPSSFTESGTNNNVLEVGEVWTLNTSRVVQAGDPDPLPNTFTATFTSSAGGLGQQATGSATHSTNLFQPSITIDKTGDTLGRVGSPVDYTIVVTNTSSADTPTLTNVTVTDTVLGNLLDATNTFVISSNADGALSVGEVWTITARRTLLSTDADPLPNTATVHANPTGFPNDITASDGHSVNVIQPSLRVVKSGDTLSKVGDVADYTFTITNNGSADSPALTGASISDSLLGNLLDPTNTFVVTSNVDGTLSVGETWTITAKRTVQAGDADPLPNTVTVSMKVPADAATGLDETTVAPDASSVLTHSVNLFQPNFSITKVAQDGDGVVTVGEIVQYLITITNTSSSDSPAMDPVSLIDTKIGALAASAFTESGTDNNALDVGETWTGTFNYTVQASDFPSLTNVVTAKFQVQDVPSAGFDGKNQLERSASDTLQVDLPHIDGRMTGGGSIFLGAGMVGGPVGTRVTHGFQLHCADNDEHPVETVNNRLEVNWGKPNNHFHLLNLTWVKCEDNPLIQAPPDAPIDTLKARGVGLFSGSFGGKKYSRVSATIELIFRDAGEPGGINGTDPADTASFKITLGNGVVVLNTDGNDAGDVPDELSLIFGNHQAHNEIPNLSGDALKIQSQIDNIFAQLDNQNLTESKIVSLTSQLLDLLNQQEALLA
jgi:hypothetical protein